MKLDLSILSPIIINKQKITEYKAKMTELKKKTDENKRKNQEKRLFFKEKLEFENKFYRLMFELSLYNKFNKTYFLSILDKRNYGFVAHLYLEPGLSFQTLEDKKGIIQENLRCIWIMKTEQFKEEAFIKIVTKPIDPNIEYTNPEIKPHEVYLGIDFSLNHIKINANKYCMFLVAGAIGSGKTRFFYLMLTSWILNCKMNEVEIYLSDVSKNEFSHMKWVKMIRYYSSTLDELLYMMRYLEKKMQTRINIISKMRDEGTGTNIEDYNKNSKSKMSYIYIVIDELSVIMPEKSDNQEDKSKKQEIIDILKNISKTTRSLGMFTIVGLQKTTREEMPSILKNESATRIGFRTNDRITSEVILEDNSAVGLQPRYAAYSLNAGDKDYLYTPYIDMTMMTSLLKPHIDKNFKKVDVEAETKVYTSNSEQQKLTKSKKNHPYEEIDTSKTRMSVVHSNEVKKINSKEDDLIDY